jgi:hypothetical protein
MLRQFRNPRLDRTEPVAQPIYLAAQRLSEPLHDAVGLADDSFFDVRHQAFDALLGIAPGRLDPLLKVVTETARLADEPGNGALTVGQCTGRFVTKAPCKRNGFALQALQLFLERRESE